MQKAKCLIYEEERWLDEVTDIKGDIHEIYMGCLVKYFYYIDNNFLKYFRHMKQNLVVVKKNTPTHNIQQTTSNNKITLGCQRAINRRD